MWERIKAGVRLKRIESMADLLGSAPSHQRLDILAGYITKRDWWTPELRALYEQRRREIADAMIAGRTSNHGKDAP